MRNFPESFTFAGNRSLVYSSTDTDYFGMI